MATHPRRLVAADRTTGDDQAGARQLQLDLRRAERATSPARRSTVAAGPEQRLALSPDEAAAGLGVSRDYFDEHVLPELRVVRRGRRILIPRVELERWLDRNAVRSTAAR
jgi:excisionase family DNA binding protein